MLKLVKKDIFILKHAKLINKKGRGRDVRGGMKKERRECVFLEIQRLYNMCQLSLGLK